MVVANWPPGAKLSCKGQVLGCLCPLHLSLEK